MQSKNTEASNGLAKAKGLPMPNRQAAGTVHLIFKLADEGWTASDIATYLNQTEQRTERGK